MLKFKPPATHIIEETAPILEIESSASVPAGGKTNVRWVILTPILLSAALNVIGQLILKSGMSQLGPVSLSAGTILPLVWSIATNSFIVVGMIIFFASFLFWLIGLSRAPLSYAYPFISLSYLAILLASHFLLGEQITLLRIGGVGLICFGVLLVASS